MSAFVVKDDIINRVLSLLGTDRDLDHIKRLVLNETGANLDSHEGRERLGIAMFQLNCNAVDQRYGEGEAKTFRKLDYAYHFVSCPTLATYKSLRCWLYQCAEGDVPGTSPLYALMERVAAELTHYIVCSLPAHYIVCSLPAYDKAKGWSVHP